MAEQWWEFVVGERKGVGGGAARCGCRLSGCRLSVLWVKKEKRRRSVSSMVYIEFEELMSLFLLVIRQLAEIQAMWDILSNGGLVQEMAHIANGRDPGNCVSLLRVNSANSSQSHMLILQESCADSTGSYVIYAPVDIVAMNVVLSGGDPDYVALLPSGFAILPDGPPGQNLGGILEVGSGGSLLTVAFQILVDFAYG